MRTRCPTCNRLHVVRDAPRTIGDVITSPNNISKLMKSYSATDKEHFVVFHLNTRHEIIETELVSMGTLDASLVHPREVFRHAIINGSAALLLSHNHPSGNITPSADDISITRRLVQAGDLLGIHVLDHVIVAKGNEHYWSAKEEGALIS